MTKKKTQISMVLSHVLRPCLALRKKWQEGYSAADFRSDLLAGVIVGMVAIPLGMALAVASGVPPQAGLYTIIVGGAIVAFLGGSRCQVSGPTAAFVVVLAPIAHTFGYGGLLLAGFMAGVILIAMGVARMGQWIEFIPYPVTTGFTSGIAVVIVTIQVKDFFGLTIAQAPENYVDRIVGIFQAFPTWSPVECAVAVSTLAILIWWSRWNQKIPAPLVALGIMTLVTAVLKHLTPDLDIATIGSRFVTNIDGQMVSGIPQALPQLGMPWHFGEAHGRPLSISVEMIESLIPSAFVIAVLGAIESLLSAVVADGMTQTQHDPDGELVALGVGNMVCPFFGGIAATGAIARTATNIRFGARSPIAAIVHAVFTLLVVLVCASYVSYLPMASLAALLMLVAYHMAEAKHFFHILRIAPRSDVIVLLACFGLTVIFDMVVGVTVGVVCAALLFMRRMAEVTSGQVLLGGHHHPNANAVLPKDVMLYEIAGPLFFGAAKRAMDAMGEIHEKVRVVILDLEDVPVMDMTGFVSFESTIYKLHAQHRKVILVGLRKQPYHMLKRAGILDQPDILAICDTVADAIRRVSNDAKPT